LERGVEVGEIRHKMPIGAWDGGFAPGVDPARGDYASFADFSDADGNRWVLQERGYRGDVGSGGRTAGGGHAVVRLRPRSTLEPLGRRKNPALTTQSPGESPYRAWTRRHGRGALRMHGREKNERADDGGTEPPLPYSRTLIFERARER